MAFRIAPAWCLPDSGASAGCADYHRLWPTLCLLGLAASLGADRTFFARAVRSCPPRAAPLQVLIAGAADAGLLDLMSTLAREEGRTAEFTVVDRCATPLELNRAYADSVGVALTTLASAVPSAGDSAFDLVCAHSLFGYLSPSQRPGWRRRGWRRCDRAGSLPSPTGFAPGTNLLPLDTLLPRPRRSAGASPRPLQLRPCRRRFPRRNSPKPRAPSRTVTGVGPQCHWMRSALPLRPRGSSLSGPNWVVSGRRETRLSGRRAPMEGAPAFWPRAPREGRSGRSGLETTGFSARLRPRRTGTLPAARQRRPPAATTRPRRPGGTRRGSRARRR